MLHTVTSTDVIGEGSQELPKVSLRLVQAFPAILSKRTAGSSGERAA